MTKEQIAQDFLDTYAKNPFKRCKTDTKCYYSPISLGVTYEQSPGCAIGKYLPHEVAIDLDKNFRGGSITDIVTEDPSKMDMLRSVFPEVNIEIDTEFLDFLSALQYLHDSDSNFTYAGLSSKGVESFNYFLKSYKINLPQLPINH